MLKNQESTHQYRLVNREMSKEKEVNSVYLSKEKKEYIRLEMEKYENEEN